eukprot:1748393-Pyramimonas_sp.AAC.1
MDPASPYVNDIASPDGMKGTIEILRGETRAGLPEARGLRRGASKTPRTTTATLLQNVGG